MKSTVLTLQEGLNSDIENCVVLAMKTLIEINALVTLSFDNIHEIVFRLLMSDKPLLLRKCCTDYFGSVTLTQ